MFHHPLSINLTTKAVWCELCNNKIVLETNNPPYYIKSKNHSKLADNNLCDNNNEDLDDFNLINYLDQETANSSHRKLLNSLNSKSNNNNSYSSYLFNFDYSSNLNGENDNNNNNNEDDESDSDLNDYFSDINQPKPIRNNKKKKNTTNQQSINGKIGLENLGNTCFMNAALQALSNCYAFTSYYLECSPYIQARLTNQASYLDLNSLNKQISLPCLAMSYMKLMRELWLVNSKKNISSFNPNELVQVIKYINPMFRGYMQHDSQEFLIYLMDQLHEELKRPIIKFETNDNNEQYDDKQEEEEEDEEENENEETVSINSYVKSSQSIDIISKEVDSGILSRLSINNNHNDDSESVESFETCDSTGICNSSDVIKTDLDEEEDETKTTSTGSFLSISPEIKRLKLKKSSKSSSSSSSISTTTQKLPTRVTYTSIISELFEGKLIGQVQCLECLNVSTTTESFLHLSLPIPTKEYLQALHTRVVNNRNQLMLNNNDSYETAQYQGWLSWMMDLMKGFIWSQTIKLTECLTAFFSDDDLKGDNMYSCEKCKKLTNGVKYSKLLDLPETLIIHLKRFRHDSMFSNKISSYVSFPLDDLEMKPFVHKECKNQVTQYDLSSIICHYGGSNGGHYTCYARNYLDEEWYEFDDSYCRKVDSLTVQNIQAYVLFYKKKTIQVDTIREKLRSIILTKTSSALTLHNSILNRPFYISKQWLQKLKHFSEPGPIDNSDFLCKHNLVRPILWNQIENLVIACSFDCWSFLANNFGIKNINDNNNQNDSICNFLFPCSQCELNDELMKKRQIYEKDEFIKLNDRSRLSFHQNGININSNNTNNKFYAISAYWFKQWEQFVQFKHCPQVHQIPGPINNLSICNQQLLKQNKQTPIYQLNKSNFQSF